MAFIATIIFGGVLATTPSEAVLQLTTTQTNLYPGETGYLTVILQNDGANPAYNTKIILNGLESPLSSTKFCNTCTLYSSNRKTCLDYNSICYNNIGDIYGSDTKSYNFPINVPSNISTGYYSVNLQVRYENNTSGDINYVEMSELMYISNPQSNPDLTVTSVNLSKNEINPGEEFELGLTIDNTGLKKAENIKVKLISDVFNTISSSNTINLVSINGQDSEQVIYELVSDESTSIGVHELTIQLNYTSSGQQYYSESTFAVRLGSKTANFELYIQDLESGTEGIEVELRVANVGLINAKSVSVTLQEEDIRIGNVNSEYIGDLDSGEYAKISFTFDSGQAMNNTISFPELRERIRSGEIPSEEERQELMQERPERGPSDLIFTISYTTPLGERITENISKEVDLIQTTAAKRAFTFTGAVASSTDLDISSIISWVVIIGLASVVIYFFIKSKRRHRK